MHTHQILPDSLAILARRCRREMKRFRANQPSDELPCLELFRRAIVEGLARAWDYLFAQYRAQVLAWVVRSLTSPATPDEIEAMTQDALTRFWRFFTVDLWIGANNLRQVLAYLRTCATSAVAQWGRDHQKRALEVALNEYRGAPASDPVKDLDKTALWILVARRCQDEADLLLARLVLAGGLKPRHVLEHYPHLFADIQDVYRRKRNLLERLQRDPALREQFKP